MRKMSKDFSLLAQISTVFFGEIVWVLEYKNSDIGFDFIELYKSKFYSNGVFQIFELFFVLFS